MRSLAKLSGQPFRLVAFFLRIYLTLFLVGCAAKRPPVHEIRSQETRLMLGEERTVFQACVGVLQDLGYTMDVANNDAGIITASRQTQELSGVITEEPEDPEEKGLPTWAKVLLIATGVILIVALVAAISGGDDDKEKETKTKPETPPPPSPPTPTYIVERDSPGGTVYQYRVTINLRPKGDAVQVRASVQGSQLDGGRVVRAGPVDDPGFFSRFFAGLDQSLRLEEQEQGR